MTEMGNANYPTNSNNQPPAGYIWPSGYYPMGINHSQDLRSAEFYVQRQERKERQRIEGEIFRQKYPEAALTLRIIGSIIITIIFLVGILT
jgi:hypothetical protein